MGPYKITPDIAEICSLLYQLGITANYIGFFHTAYAVCLAVQQPKKLCTVTKGLYAEVAEHYATTWQCVERNIRTSIGVAWKANPALLEKLAQYPLTKKPNTSRFLSILARKFSSDSEI